MCVFCALLTIRIAWGIQNIHEQKTRHLQEQPWLQNKYCTADRLSYNATTLRMGYNQRFIHGTSKLLKTTHKMPKVQTFTHKTCQLQASTHKTSMLQTSTHKTSQLYKYLPTKRLCYKHLHTKLLYQITQYTVIKIWTFSIVNHWVLHGNCDKLREFSDTFFCD